MPWNNQGGGWGPGGNDGGPWGRGPSGGGGGGGQPPDLEDLIRKMQDRGRRFVPGSFGGGKGIAIAVLVLLVVWLVSGVYRVDTNQQGVELVFGKWVATTEEGLNYNWPGPIGQVYTPAVTEIQQFTVGNTANESLMLTGDENIIDVKFVVKWKIKDAGQFLFNVTDPIETTRNVSESAMRQVIGRTALATALAEGRAQVEQETLTLMQEMLDSYGGNDEMGRGAGVLITQVELQSVDPPAAVIDAFRDVQAARADQERSINEAQAYQNQIVPVARGESQRMIQEAEAYKEQVINDAEGAAARFLSVYNEYVLAKDVTERRIYLETMETVLRDMEKIVIDNGASDGQGVVPYLPLDQLRRSADQQ
ncbi:MAG: FtsH protease activity modulator HflK [Rhodospirillales bacterium]|nr:FtsH protease activity modulator HflK [Rhodospirillales bacterium]